MEPKKPFDFHLKLDSRVNDEEVSRVLSMMVNIDTYAGESVFHLLTDIEATYFSPTDGEANLVVRNMLRILLTSGNTCVSHCFDCNKYVASFDKGETVCAYDSENQLDSHRIYKISMLERDDRLFFGIWGEGYAQKDGVFPLTGNMTMDAIKDEHGYTEESVAAIEQLNVGESYDCTDLSGMHVVVRVR